MPASTRCLGIDIHGLPWHGVTVPTHSWCALNPPARRSSEYLPGMPRDVPVRGISRALLGRTNGAVVVVQEPAYGRARAVQLPRYQQPIACPALVLRQTDGSTIESAMMERTQRQPVGDVIGAAVGVPLDVRGFEPKQIVLETQIEVAHRAPPFVGGQHRVAGSGGRGGDGGKPYPQPRRCPTARRLPGCADAWEAGKCSSRSRRAASLALAGSLASNRCSGSGKPPSTP